ncbi:MAG: hypothetical protein EOO17_01530 [Chloroflexi bacterium]|nr:MAG: hypothetical protein EOO17_01530 [Chloroflexota bacterium]
MKHLSLDTFNELLSETTLKPRIKRELKFVASTQMLADDWSDRELLAIADRTGQKGVLLLQPNADLYIASYELSRTIVDSMTGRQRAIICDFCYTWQAGSNAASVTIADPVTKSSVRFLCCADLNCSQHVRTLTKESIMSRAQLRESIDNNARVQRLQTKLVGYIDQLHMQKVDA